VQLAKGRKSDFIKVKDLCSLQKAFRVNRSVPSGDLVRPTGRDQRPNDIDQLCDSQQFVQSVIGSVRGRDHSCHGKPSAQNTDSHVAVAKKKDDSISASANFQFLISLDLSGEHSFIPQLCALAVSRPVTVPLYGDPVINNILLAKFTLEVVKNTRENYSFPSQRSVSANQSTGSIAIMLVVVVIHWINFVSLASLSRSCRE
jgi:hypothetical protein